MHKSCFNLPYLLTVICAVLFEINVSVLTLAVHASSSSGENDPEVRFRPRNRDNLIEETRELLSSDNKTSVSQQLAITIRSQSLGELNELAFFDIYQHLTHADITRMKRVNSKIKHAIEKIENKDRLLRILNQLNRDSRVVGLTIGGMALGYLGLLPSNIESGMFFMYSGARKYGYFPPPGSSLTIPIIIGIVASRAPVHISRCTSIVPETRELSQDYPRSLLRAQIFHAFLNHSFPLGYTGLMAERSFPGFASVIVPPLVLSNFSKGLQPRDCIFRRITEGRSSSISTYSQALTGVTAISKGYMIGTMVYKGLDDLGFNEYTTRSLISIGAGTLSTVLTIGFEGDRLSQYLHYMRQNRIDQVLLTTVQGSILMSIYSGMGMELAAPPLAYVSMWVLETMNESLSIDYHFRQRIIPTAKKAFQKVQNRVRRFW